MLASLLGVDDAMLERMLLQRVVEARGDVIIRHLDVQDAERTRDAIVKSLYEVGGRRGGCR